MKYLITYDIENDKICNAKKGTVEWWHERGHQENFHKNKALKWFMSMFSIYSSSFLAILMFLSVNTLLQIIGALFIMLLFVDELHAWYYAIKNKNKWVK